MKKLLLAGAAIAVIAGSTAVYAEHRPWGHHHARMNPEDRAAFADARIAAVRAGLKLTPDQDKLWPAVKGAVRDFVKLRTDRANARMAARRDDGDRPMDDNPVARLSRRADDMAATAAALKKIADAADPLYKTLDDGQKRRLSVLTHMRHRFGEDDRPHGPRPGVEHDGFQGPGAGSDRGPRHRDDDDDDDDDRGGPPRPGPRFDGGRGGERL